eukprot:gnl/TRDRNA2_/TRDRNA2_38484_c0_seq1.p1 gnl/TRDRNA2_/TRDRNA2_38484_c0~~gnl/TRDRNA2_/TRDRNA2_38484_c0_seq1.p1  ORF type:complete len:345 (+),score=56.39 gnl/TRDRNA2_/TRDRNA2_38484_c0_seq1:42-1076(+)
MRLSYAVRCGAAGAAAQPIDFRAAVKELGLQQKLIRKPWVLIDKHREALEEKLGLGLDHLLVGLSQWLSSASGAPTAVGLAHVSGNVYFARAVAQLSAEQALLANVFSHNEIGLDAVVGCGESTIPEPETVSLLREVVTFRRMRWVQPSGLESAAAKKPRQSFASSARKKLLTSHPLLTEIVGDLEGGKRHGGKCLQHPNFGHRDVEGDSLDEWQLSLARNSALRAYRPPVDAEGDHIPLPLVGCALRTADGVLYPGSTIGTRWGCGSISPVQMALVSMSANGACAEDVVSAVWATVGDPDCPKAAELREKDQVLLSKVVGPQGAAFGCITVAPANDHNIAAWE